MSGRLHNTDNLLRFGTVGNLADGINEAILDVSEIWRLEREHTWMKN
jgi:hypothetical protein